MEEKTYKTMGSSGILSLVIGIIICILGVGAGIAMIINGGRLLKSKRHYVLDYSVKSHVATSCSYINGDMTL